MTSNNGNKRTINDVDQDLVDEYRPRLTQEFNTIAQNMKRVENDPSLAQDEDFVKEFDTSLANIQGIAIEFLMAGGSEEDFGIIAEDAALSVLPPPKP